MYLSIDLKGQNELNYQSRSNHSIIFMIGLSLPNGNAKYSNIKQTIQLFNQATQANKD